MSLLDELLGDPFDDSNPLSMERIMQADENREFPSQGEEVLDRWGLNAEFVPRQLGGRFSTVDQLIDSIRPLFRRDASLGLGYGVTSLMAAVNIWAGGSEKQQRRMSRLLLAGEKVAVAYHELAHGNDFVRNELRATVSAAHVAINGSKEVINNVERAAAIVVFARTRDGITGRDHSIIFLDKSEVLSGRLRYKGRYRTSGLRGCLLGGVEFSDVVAPASSVVGRVGYGVEIAMRSFQVTRTVLPGVALGLLDTCIRSVLHFAMHRLLYSISVSEIPHVRDVLSKAFVDLLIADCMVHTVARALHVMPSQCSSYSAAVKYLLPLMLEESMTDLSMVLSARSYLRTGRYAIVGKNLRDISAISFGHAGGVACLLAIIAQLPQLARRAQDAAFEADELFDLRSPLRDFAFDKLSVLNCRSDSVMQILSIQGSGADGEARIRPLLDELSGFVDALWQESHHIPANERGPAAGPKTMGLAERYAVLLAAAACVGTWRFHRTSGGNPFLAGNPWILAALLRIRQRLRGVREALPSDVCEDVFAELSDRFHRNLSFDLIASPTWGA